MFAFLKKRYGFALILGLALVLPISYFTLGILGRNRKLDIARRLPELSGSNVASKNPATSNSVTHNPSYSLSLDSDNDGLPDSAELQSFMDRENFRRWFTLIAEGQFYRLSKEWNAEQRDCSGLVRFAWREALRRHDRAWFQKMGPGYKAIAPDVARYNLEQSPLGEKLFRTNFGSYKEGDLSTETFSEFADARTLKSFNVRFVSRDRHHAQPGDLLFYYQPWVQKFPYHVMLFLGDSKLSDEQSADWVVYHTGASPTDEGTVKKVELSVLDHHPNRRWRPVETNTNFLGFYRLKILD
jgi:uncharacterized protein YfaT (DUF1175 family)